jgi:hypothetical protein
MNDDPRCCGSGTCIIDAEGRCWCGQRWDGQKMCFERASSDPQGGVPPDDNQSSDQGSDGGD